jgi:hypothetical protein
MGVRMVTVASFDQAVKARLAENVLKAAGIPVAVADETIVAMDWLLSNAVGGIKVQVWEEDAERAVAALERELGENGEKLGPVDEEWLAAEAEAAGREDGVEPEPEPAARTPDPKPAEGGAAPSPRDEFAQRAFNAAFLGLPLPPVALYAEYLIGKAALGDGPLSRRGRDNLIGGGLMAAAWPLVAVVVFLSWRYT